MSSLEQVIKAAEQIDFNNDYIYETRKSRRAPTHESKVNGRITSQEIMNIN